MRIQFIVPTLALLTLFTSCNLISKNKNKDYPIQPVAFTQVLVTDNFWAPKIKINAEVSIPYTLEKCETKGRIDNLFRAAGKLNDDKCTSFTFDETDIYKVIEGASYSLQSNANPDLEIQVDTLISYIAAAQEEDGYLYTFRTMNNSKPHDWIGENRWDKVEDLSHELYNVGHLYEAAAAHFAATGKRNLLDIALKNADLLVKTFGKGKVEKFPGHQIVEIGLVKLYRITGKKQYLDLAKYFLDLRGEPGHLNQEYSQSHIKVVDQHTAVGHAVRAAYMYTGMADVAALTGDQQYLTAIDNIWHDVVDKKIYITGGIGATNHGEAFGDAYNLPNMSAYAETCAAIANVYWNIRMFLLHGDSKYIDVLERTLYNGLLSGVSLSGDHFFYPNPLESMGQHQRSAWHDCACCISNMTRFLPSMPGYVYAQNNNDLYVNLFVGSTSKIKLPVSDIQIVQNTNYPWEGKNEIIITPEKEAQFALHVRIPGWAVNELSPGDLYENMEKTSETFTLLLNGAPLSYQMEKGYAVVNRKWNKGDTLLLDLPMTIHKVIANKHVKADKDRFALQMGPIVYCLEGPDNKDNAVLNIVVDKKAKVQSEYKPKVLNGVVVLKMQGSSTKKQLGTTQLLHSTQEVTAIPYYAWANRGPAEMKVWIPYVAEAAKPTPAPTIASQSHITGSSDTRSKFNGLNDQQIPADSSDRSAAYIHWWPKSDTTEWVQYDFQAANTVSNCSVYWFDDGPDGGCRIPTDWKIVYKKGNAWLPVKNTSPYTITKHAVDVVHFKPIRTSALKLEIQLPKTHSSGMYEWSVN